MNELTLFCADESASQTLGQTLAAVVSAPLVMSLHGDIGAGKTTILRAMLRQLGVSGAIKSPTFAVIEPYQLPSMMIYHLDCYRIVDPEELEFLGIRDYLQEQAVLCIEWPERGEGILPTADLQLSLNIKQIGREITIVAGTPRGDKLVSSLTLAITEAATIEIR